MLEDSSPLLCHDTNHSFIILTDYTKSYGCPDFKIHPTQILLRCPASHASLLTLVGPQLRPGELLLGRTAHVNIHFRA